MTACKLVYGPNREVVRLLVAKMLELPGLEQLQHIKQLHYDHAVIAQKHGQAFEQPIEVGVIGR